MHLGVHQLANWADVWRGSNDLMRFTPSVPSVPRDPPFLSPGTIAGLGRFLVDRPGLTQATDSATAIANPRA